MNCNSLDYNRMVKKEYSETHKPRGEDRSEHFRVQYGGYIPRLEYWLPLTMPHYEYNQLPAFCPPLYYEPLSEQERLLGLCRWAGSAQYPAPIDQLKLPEAQVYRDFSEGGRHRSHEASSFLKVAPEKEAQPRSCEDDIKTSYLNVLKIEEVSSHQLQSWLAHESREKMDQQLDTKKTSAPQAIVKLIGGLTSQERQAKINLYREKRKRRTYTKRVAYDCRKKVADQRIRIKGRFVTKQQALELLQIADDDFPTDRVKELLSEQWMRSKIT